MEEQLEHYRTKAAYYRQLAEQRGEELVDLKIQCGLISFAGATQGEAPGEDSLPDEREMPGE